ncbi:MAG: type II toxin-antitoxin system prevent-host-death family antitoxin [Treponema sp.]|nr:type II toxin-antitoxin system prevent-host-death family antitoxin [Candidatus Treponema equifaecale]
MSNAIPIFEAKNKLPLFIHKAEEEGPVVLSRRNKDVAVIISMAEYQSLLKQVKASKSKMTFLERLQLFKEENKDLYSDGEIDEFIEAINNRDLSCPHYEEAAHLFDGIMEGTND